MIWLLGSKGIARWYFYCLGIKRSTEEACMNPSSLLQTIQPGNILMMVMSIRTLSTLVGSLYIFLVLTALFFVPPIFAQVQIPPNLFLYSPTPSAPQAITSPQQQQTNPPQEATVQKSNQQNQPPETLTPSPSQEPLQPQQNGILDGIASFASYALTLGNPVHFDHPRQGFSRAELPNFTVIIPTKTNEKIGATEDNTWQTKDELIQAELINNKTNEVIPVTIKKTGEGQFHVTAIKTDSLTPGEYHLALDAKETFLYTRDLTQDFSWGVLAVNTNKSIYAPGETAHLAFGVVDNFGETICNASLSLTITDPHGMTTTLSTDNGKIEQSHECSGNTVTKLPDYLATYQTTTAGYYQMVLIAHTKNGTHTLSDYFQVEDTVPFSVDRASFPTRVYPLAAYDVKLTITANQDYTGPVTDSVPKAFYITDISDGGSAPNQLKDDELIPATNEAQLANDTNAIPPNATLSKLDTVLLKRSNTVENFTEASVDHTPMSIIWQVHFQKGHIYTLSYTINFPPVSPEFYLLGPLRIGDFQEVRQWQIASDATKCWAGTAGANWSGGSGTWITTAGANSTLATGDVATFDPGTGTCASPGGNNTNSTLDTGLTFSTISGINIKSTYTQTITDNKAMTVSSGNYAQAGGTWSGGSVNMTVTGTFTLSGGTFNAPSGTITVKNAWNTAGGTFNAGTGTVLFEDASFTITPSSETYNNVKFTHTNTCGTTRTFTIAASTTLTVGGMLTLDNTDGCGGNVVINGTGGISAQGDISLPNSFGSDGGDVDKGSVVITINGTGTQTMTGVAGGTTDNATIPSININKASGTLNIHNTITEVNDWTWMQGTVDYTGSTVIFDAVQDNASTITPGSTAFNNVTFDRSDTCSSNATYTIAASTTLTVGGTLTFDNNDTCGNFTIVNGTGGISAQGDISAAESNRGVKGSVVVTINGTGIQTMTGPAAVADANGEIPSITINKASGTFNIRNTITEANDWTWIQGTVDYTGSTIYFNAEQDDTATITPGSTAFNNVTFDHIDTCGPDFTTTIAASTTLTVGGTLTFDNNDGCGGNTMVNGTGTIASQGNLTTASNGVNGNVQITMSGSANQTITQSGSNIFPTGTFTVNKSGGTATLATNFSENASGQSVTITAGTLDLSGHNLTVNSTGMLTVNGTGVLQLQGGETITATNKSFVSGGTVIYTGSGTYSSLAAGSSYYNLTFNGSGSWTAANSTTLGGSLTISSGTFIAPSSTLTIGGNFTHNGGTFTNNGGTVAFNDNSQASTISGANTFNNLSITTGGKQVNFPASTATTISNALTIQGSVGANVLLRSSSPGVQANLAVNGTPSLTTISRVDIEDSNACPGTNQPLTANIATNSGDNSCWAFSNTWYNTAWKFRKLITINHTKVAADQTNFPVLISWANDTSLANNAQTGGNDILFTDSTGVVKLNHEIEKYVSGTGELEAWVNVPTLSSTTDTTLYVYYGNPSAENQQNATGVWSNSYVLVQHLAETSGTTTNDSSGNGNSGTKVSATSPNPTTSGQIDGAQSFNGSTDHITISNTASMQFTSSQSYTISAWVNVPSLPGAWATIVEHSRSSSPWYGLWINPSNKWAFGGGSGGAANIVGSTASTGWHYLVGVQQGSVIRTLYVDGQSNATGSVQNANGTGGMEMGDDTVSEPLAGTIDEVRLSNTNRSASWIQTEYNNQSSLSTFMTVGSGEQLLTVVNGGVTIHGGTTIKSN
jgi:hypothetical protein